MEHQWKLLAGVALVSGMVLALFASPSFAGTSVRFAADCDHPRAKPRTVLISCGDGGLYLTGLRWRKWDQPRATATGTAHRNDCEPFCAAGHFHDYRARLQLSDIGYCANTDRMQYRRVTVRFIGSKPRGPRTFSLDYGCGFAT